MGSKCKNVRFLRFHAQPANKKETPFCVSTSLGLISFLCDKKAFFLPLFYL